MMTRQDAFKLLRNTASLWSDRNVPRFGASLAYYTLLSTAPLLLLLLAILGLVFDRNTAEANLISQVREVAGRGTAETLGSLLKNAHQAGNGVIATMVAIGTLLFGASGVFLELRDSLNTIWDAPPITSTWRTIVWQRVISFGMVLALGFLLLASLLISAGMAVLVNFFQGVLPIKTALFGEAMNFILPLIAISILFGLIFKFVPDVPIDWRDVAVGAIVSALLFQIGKGLLALYLGTTGVGSTYGAAGSLVAFVVWVYYSAQIFFFGAIFTHEYAKCYGSHSGENNPAPQTSEARAGSAKS